MQCGHAIEARVYSEDPRRGFLPSTGRIERFAFPPEEAGWRVDRGVEDGDAVTVHYDPMIAKVIASGADRDAAIERMRQCLARTAVFGPASNLDLLRRIVSHRDFRAGAMDTGYLDRHLEQVLGAQPPVGAPTLLAAADHVLRSLADEARTCTAPRSPWSAGDAWRLGGLGQVTFGVNAPGFIRLRARRRDGRVEVSGEGVEARAIVVPGEHDAVSIGLDGGQRELTLVAHGRRLVVTDTDTHEIAWVDPWPFEAVADDLDSHPASPLPGRVVELHVSAGQSVQAGEALAVVEGMKMQHTIRAGRDGVVTRVNVSAGDLVEADAVLCDIDTHGATRE